MIGVIGLGNMGRGMALSLRRGGYEVIGTDAAEATRQRLADEGIRTVATIAEVCGAADFILLSLPTAAIVAEVVSGPGGILDHAKPGLLVVDTSSSAPDTTRRLAASLSAVGAAMIDAPVSGGPKGAITGTMTMVMGGEASDIARAEPVLAAISGKRVHVGSSGAGHVTKIVNNLLVGAHLLIASEAVRLAQAANVDPERLLEGVNGGSGRSAVTQVNFPTWILNRAFDSGFTMKLMRKDVKLAADLARNLGLSLSLTDETTRIWAKSAEIIPDGEDFDRIVGINLDL